MMIRNFNLLLLSGGFYHCSPSWNKNVSGLDRCYKFYFPMGGNADVVVDGAHISIETGFCYFLSGFHIEQQSCDKDLDVYWIHFIPESLYFRYIFRKMKPFYQWDISNISLYQAVYTKFDLLFTEPFARINRGASHPPAGLKSKTQSLLLYLIGSMMESYGPELMDRVDPELQRLKPSVDFMDSAFTTNPSLAEIAQQSHLAPNYFHRMFTRKFGLTPLNYLIIRRLEYAQELLRSVPMSIREIAEQCGYENEFYFSRIFKKHIGTSPSSFRNEEWVA